MTIQNLTMGIVKGFNPVLVYGGAYSTMSIDLINPNTNTALTGIAFTDDMTLLGTGMKLANPVAFNTGTCGGTLTGNPGDASFSYSGGALPANSTCTLSRHHFQRRLQCLCHRGLSHQPARRKHQQKL
ncbi:MAG: hypothetical protein DWB59_12565 [Anaerolineae bacterium]|nr:hypothetical protein [Anaerolineae bacterium]